MEHSTLYTGYNTVIDGTAGLSRYKSMQKGLDTANREGKGGRQAGKVRKEYNKRRGRQKGIGRGRGRQEKAVGDKGRLG